MTSIVARELQSPLDVLRAQKAAQTQLQPRARLNFTAHLLEAFGQRYAGAIRAQLRGDSQQVFDQLHRAFFEVQKRLELGRTGYAKLTCPEMAKIVEGYRIENRSDEQFFAILKELSYGILPFPHRTVLYYAEPELETLERVESVRDRAFYNLVRCLKIEVVDDHKEVEPPPPPKPLSADEEMALTKLYFGGGALVYDRKTVFFSEMVEMWANFSAQNEHTHKSLLGRLTTRDWVQSVPKPVMAFLKYHQCNSFQEFLILSSIDAVQKNLGFDFSPSVAQDMEKRFVAEQNRYDLCYFTVDLPRFYELDVTKFNRFSKNLIRSFQLFYFITRNFGVEDGAHNALLRVLLHMDSRINEKRIPGFCERRWQKIPMSQDEIGAFRTSWDGVLRILRTITKRNVSFVDPTPEDEALFKDFECSNLLLFLWQNPKRALLIEMVCKFSALPGFSATLTSTIAFCRENEDSLKPEMVAFIPENYAEVIQALQESGVDVQGSERIFFDPPLKLTQNMAIRFGTAGVNTKKFIALLAPYHFPIGKEFYLMLRHFIFHPFSLTFDLLKDLPLIGVEPTVNVLWDALSRSHESFEPEPIPTQETRERAKVITAKIQGIYRFSDVQLFEIYLEVIRLIVNHRAPALGRVSRVIHELVDFCPALQKKDIYFLFRYHPEINSAQVVALAAVRADWAKSEAQLRRFVIKQSQYEGIIRMIENFVVPLSEVCKDEFIANKFDQTCQRSLLSAFFPPLQPLSDYFRITNLTNDGIRWGEPVWRTHLGQLKFILGQANIGVYVNWSIQKDRPVLFMSFFDIAKREAVSAFIPIRVSAAEIEPEPIRKPFYGLLGQLSGQVLKEQADSDLPEDALETPDSWIPCYTGLQETLDSYASELETGNLKIEHIREMFAFLRDVKISYRNLFLSSVAGRRIPEFLTEEPQAIAALGHVFPHQRGSLLPKALLEVDPHPEFYTPDAAPEFAEACRDLFDKPTAHSELLNLSLNMPKGKLPIAYHVQTAEQLTGPIEHQGNRNEVAPAKEQEEGRYVTLSIDGANVPLRYPREAFANSEIFLRYFDYHNLLLKAAAYSGSA